MLPQRLVFDEKVEHRFNTTWPQLLPQTNKVVTNYKKERAKIIPDKISIHKYLQGLRFKLQESKEVLPEKTLFLLGIAHITF